MTNTQPEVLAINGLDNVIRQWEVNRDNLKGDDVATLSSLITNDLGDVRNIRNYLLNDGNFYKALEMVMDLDSAPRDEIVEEWDTQGLRKEMEDTGQIVFAEKRIPVIETQPVINAIAAVKKHGGDRVVFVDGKMVAVLEGEVRGMYEVHVAANPVELTTA